MQTRPEAAAKLRQAPVRKRLVLFDFDGTITAKDTLAQIMIHYRGAFRYRYGLVVLAPIMALYLLRLIPNWKAKQFLLSWFFKGEDEHTFNKRCREFAETVLPSLIRPKAL
ncbi:MAG TPA: haloacid dehalogenase-like hydrolase, partial [Chryseosolibacter sp.]|nr:haloacid dehalogenase-like hydrolase [Chryseosolibacter sp.]